jgi:hypothetical protein
LVETRVAGKHVRLKSQIIDNKAITASAIEHVHALFEDKRDQPNEVPKPELQQIKLLQSSVA